MEEAVRVSRHGGVLKIVLDRPKANAIDLPTSQKMGEAFVTLRDDPELAVGVITGAGEKIFSAGWDLKALNSGEMQMDNWWEDDYGPGGFAGITELWDLNKPVIGALNGLVIGGGFELALACDMLIAAEHVEFALPELPLGLVPDAGAIQRLTRRLPYNKAMEMYLMGTLKLCPCGRHRPANSLSRETAHEHGLIVNQPLISLKSVQSHQHLSQFPWAILIQVFRYVISPTINGLIGRQCRGQE